MVVPTRDSPIYSQALFATFWNDLSCGNVSGPILAVSRPRALLASRPTSPVHLASYSSSTIPVHSRPTLTADTVRLPYSLSAAPRLSTLCERREAQDSEQRQLLHYISQLNSELDEVVENLYMFLDFTQGWHEHCLSWLRCHPECSSFETEITEGHRRTATAVEQAQRQFYIIEEMMEEINVVYIAEQAHLILTTPQCSNYLLGATITLYLGMMSAADQELSDDDNGLDLERHHILTLDRWHGQYLDEIVHLALVVAFSLNIPVVDKLIKRM
ncbi:hypothetical protein BGZ93_008069 [Podila epicladia]|nr:hypothetical protein BGZ93_008069 [Podila epicladia]